MRPSDRSIVFGWRARKRAISASDESRACVAPARNRQAAAAAGAARRRQTCVEAAAHSRATVRLQLMAVHHHVDHAVLLQIFGALEAVGQLLADGLLDDARPGEADERAGLGEMDVAEHGVGRRDAAGRRIGEHDDIGQFRARAAGAPRPWCAASA